MSAIFCKGIKRKPLVDLAEPHFCRHCNRMVVRVVVRNEKAPKRMLARDLEAVVLAAAALHGEGCMVARGYRYSPPGSARCPECESSLVGGKCPNHRKTGAGCSFAGNK